MKLFNSSKTTVVLFWFLFGTKQPLTSAMLILTVMQRPVHIVRSRRLIELAHGWIQSRYR